MDRDVGTIKLQYLGTLVSWVFEYRVNQWTHCSTNL